MRQHGALYLLIKITFPVLLKKVAATYPEERQENRENYLNEPNAILVVIMETSDIPKQWDENFGAVSAMIQNFWLLAWEEKLGIVWKTNPHIYDEKVKEILHVKDNEKIAAFIHMGYFDETPEEKERIPLADKFEVFEEDVQKSNKNDTANFYVDELFQYSRIIKHTLRLEKARRLELLDPIYRTF